MSLPDLFGQSREMDRVYYVYILTNKRNGTFYTGITNDLMQRVWQYKEKAVEGFTEKYNVDKLVYYEIFGDSETAIKREKRIKKYPRRWKLNLIEKDNPEWKDLYEELISGLPE